MSTTKLPARDECARRVYPDDLQQKEEAWIRERRRHALDPPPPEDQAPPHIGVGISGGGIRSATFALGFFQALARKRLIRTIDVLSTVSGGGYFGAFLGALYGRPFVRDGKDAVQDVEDALAEREGFFKVPGHEKLALREPARRLRENGRYLAPNGGGDLLLAAAGLLRNWLIVQATVWLSLTTFFLLLHVGQRWLLDALRPRLEASGKNVLWIADHGGLALLLALGLLGLWILPSGWGYWVVEKLRIVLPPDMKLEEVPPKQKRRWVEKRFYGPVIVTIVLLVSSVVLASGEPPAGVVTPLLVVGAIAIVAMWIAALLGPPFGRREPARKEEAIAVLAPLGPSLALLLSAVVAAWSGPCTEDDSAIARWLGVACFALTLVMLVFVSVVMLVPEKTGEPPGAPESRAVRPIGRLRWFRNLITRRFKNGLLLLGVVGALALVAWAGGRAHEFLTTVGDRTTKGWLSGITASIGVALASAKRLLLLVGDRAGKRERPALTPTMIAGLIALVVAAVLLVGSDLIARLLLDDAKSGFKGFLGDHFDLAVLITALVVMLVMGRSLRLLNLSSQQNFYGQRLIRAYLGSSNVARLNGRVALAEAVKSDDALPAEYWRNDRGAPLHLVNVTINETFDGRSQVEQRDRKGVALSIGACGMSAGARHHAVVNWKADPAGVGAIAPTDGFRIFGKDFEPQTLTVGEWVAISGAAFSTGIGARTNLGMSLLCGLANVRLGFWWDSKVQRDDVHGMSLQRWFAKLFPLQGYLLNELLAQFPGPSWRHWYLSDGGHFENLAGYELIRRQLKSILILDGEQDADYRFEGLGNLVRFARVDFGTDIRFLDEAELDDVVDPKWRRVFGSLDHLRRGTWSGLGKVTGPQSGRTEAKLESTEAAGRSLAHVALARVRYPGSGGLGWLLYVKTTMVGDEPVDLAHYHSQHADFPHESTSDQFFDEAQWESYRKLGDVIASKLFDRDRCRPRDDLATFEPSTGGGSWSPVDLLHGVPPERMEQIT